VENTVFDFAKSKIKHYAPSLSQGNCTVTMQGGKQPQCTYTHRERERERKKNAQKERKSA